MRLEWAAVALTVAAAPLVPVRAQDAFEIQVYDSETAPPGGIGLETHLNHADAITHVTFEPHLGLASWAEVGAYFQTAVRGTGELDFAGVKLRAKLRLPGKLWDAVGLSLNGEVASIPARYEANRFGGEVRPIVDVRMGRFYASVNPIVSLRFAGPLAGHPELEPCAKASIRLADGIAVGPEYYGALGPLDDLAPAAEQVHRIFGVLDLSHEIGAFKLDANLGVGYGLSAGERRIVKAILAVDYGG
jgi:hypothetical protein